MTDTYKILGQEVALSNVEYEGSFLALVGSTSEDTMSRIAVDSQNNVYLVGNKIYDMTGFNQTDPPTPPKVTVAKFSSSGILEWEKLYSAGAAYSYPQIAIDSQDNAYLSWLQDIDGGGSNTSAFVVAKLNSDGVLQWQRFLGGSSQSDPVIATDSQDNIYLVGNKFYRGNFVVAKWNSDGEFQWQRFLGGSGNELSNSVQPQLKIDSLDNVYLVGWQTSGGEGNYDFVVAKWNSAGVLQWQRFLGGSGSENNPVIAIDSQDNVYLTGRHNSDTPIIAKWNSDGQLQWQRFLDSPAGALESIMSLSFDSNDNVYLAFSDKNVSDPDSLGGWDFLIFKWSTSGQLLWNRRMGKAGNEFTSQIAVDSQDYVYLVGAQSNSVVGSYGNYDIIIAKWNSDGQLQWQSLLGGSGSEYSNYFPLAFDSQDNLYFAGQQTSAGYSGFDTILAKLPPEGITGTYTIRPDFGFGSFTLYPGDLTEKEDELMTPVVGSMTEQAGTLTEQEDTLPEQAGSLTEEESPLSIYSTSSLAVGSQDSIVYTVPSSTNASISTIALINTGTESATYKLAAVPADEVENNSEELDLVVTSISKPEFRDAKAIIPTKTIEPNTTHEILGGITLEAGDQIRVNSASSDLIVQVYGVEIV